MKKYIRYILFSLLIAIMAFMLFKIIRKSDKKKAMKEIIRNLPDMDFYKLDGTLFRTSELKNDLFTVLIYFSPDCPECNNEADDIFKHLSEFSGSRILMVSNRSTTKVKSFAQKHQLSNLPAIIFLTDSLKNYHKFYDTNVLPCIFIYDKNRKLLKYFEGQTKVEALVQWIRN